VQCIDDGGLVAAITERVCPTAAVGRLAAGDRVVRSCRGVALLRRWLAGAVGGLPQVVGCSGEAGSARRGCWRRSRMRRNPWAQVLSARSLAPASARPYWLWEQLFRAEAVASFPLRLPGWLRSERSARCSILLPEPRLPTLGPPGHYLNCCSKAGGRASHGVSTLRAFLVFARRHARPSHVAVKRVLRFQHSPSPDDATM
jgi:hypothetical protein